MKWFSASVLSVLVSVASADMSLAKRAMPTSIDTTKIVSYFEETRKTRKLTGAENEVFELVLIARDVFAVSKITSRGYSPKIPDAIDARAAADAIASGIHRRAGFDLRLSPAELARLNSKSSVLREIWGSDSYEWAWLTLQRGEKLEAKRVLVRAFDKEFVTIMGAKSIPESQSVIAGQERVLKALAPMSTPDEKQERDGRLQKMRLHISQMPDMMIMT